MDPSAAPLHSIEDLCQEIVIKIPDELETNFGSEECIYRVPATIRDLNRAAYNPREISIGPIHHDHDEKLKAMEVQKWRYLKLFCSRRGVQKKEREKLLTTLLGTIKDQEARIRRFYAADTSGLMKSDEFVKMVLFDAVFIFELFLRDEEFHKSNCSKHEDDFIIGKPWLRHAIRRDLILLENQLPFSTLEQLYGLAMSDSSLSFLNLSCLYFRKYRTKPEAEFNPKKEILHFTDLVRRFLSFSHPDSKIENEAREIKTLHSATMLKQAGIKFRAMENECLLDIRAWEPLNKKGMVTGKKGELHMPPLQIDSTTECLFRNLMALEQLHYTGEEYVCRYVKLLDFLVDVEDDVDFLIENKVIISHLGDSKAVAKIINKLCTEMVQVSSCFNPLSKLLNDYYGSSWNKNRAYLVSVYFKNVWIGTGTVAGFIILAITVTRFILDYVRIYGK